MSCRHSARLMLGFSACVIALTAACAEVDGDTRASGDASAFAGPGAVFTVTAPAELVAAEGQAWMLAQEADETVLSRLNLEGQSTPVMRVPGQSLQLLPLREGVILGSVACADDSCEETVAKLVVVDGQGSTILERELSREPGPPDDNDGMRLLGVREDLVWVLTGSSLTAVDLNSGETIERGPEPRGWACLLEDGLYSLASLDGPAGARQEGAKPFDEPYQVAIDRFADGTWTEVADSRRLVTQLQLALTECVGGSLRTGPADVSGPAWSPVTGWVEAEPYIATINRGSAALPYITVVALGQENQRFALERDGVLSRVFAAPDAPLIVEPIKVPAEIFFHDRNGPPPGFRFDRSATTFVGCVSQSSISEAPSPIASPARCLIGSV